MTIRLGAVRAAVDSGLSPEAAVAVATERLVPLRKGDHTEAARAVLERLRSGSQAPLVWSENRWWRYEERGIWSELSRTAFEFEVATLADWAVYVSENPRVPPEPPRMTANMKKSIYSLAKDLAGVDAGFFDQAEAGLCFTNGFLTLTGDGLVLRAHSPSHRARHTQSYDWDPAADYGPWDRFLDEVWAGADDLKQRKAFLAEFLGAALVGHSTVHNRVCLLIGTGANGKSVLCDVVHGLFAAEGVVSIPPQDLHKEAHLARLAGAQLNLVSDIPGSDLIDSGVFKQITSGDQVTAKPLYCNPFEFRPKAGHLFSANTLPLSGDHTKGFYRRWVLLSFTRMFDGSVSKDALVARLRDCYPGIMRWAMEGAMNAARRPGYLVPTSSKVSVEDWKHLSDQVSAFLEDRCEVHVERTHNEATKRTEVYKEYRAWAEVSGHARLSEGKLYRRLTDLGVDAWQNKYGERMLGLSVKKLPPTHPIRRFSADQED